jgi:hypothetical protein
VKGLVPLLKMGANIIGSCCGSTPEHIRAFRKVMDEFLASEENLNQWRVASKSRYEM